MSHIPPIDQVMRSLGVQSLLEKAASRELKESSAGTNKQTARPALADASNYIIQQVRSISSDDPQRRRRAFRAFLEGRLADMIGRDALHTPAFHNMLDQVQDTMYSNADVARAMDEVADYLLSNSLDPATVGKLTAAFRPPSATRIDATPNLPSERSVPERKAPGT